MADWKVDVCGASAARLGGGAVPLSLACAAWLGSSRCLRRALIAPTAAKGELVSVAAMRCDSQARECEAQSLAFCALEASRQPAHQCVDLSVG
eukprot:4115114-Prymnesium_polylepis.1